MRETRRRDKISIATDKPTKVNIFRSSTCIDVVKQLPGGIFNVDNWRISCDCCLEILQGGNKRKKRKKTTVNTRLRCKRPLSDDFMPGNVTDSLLKYSILCHFSNETPIDSNEVTAYPSKRCNKDRTPEPPLIFSPSPPTPSPHPSATIIPPSFPSTTFIFPEPMSMLETIFTSNPPVTLSLSLSTLSDAPNLNTNSGPSYPTSVYSVLHHHQCALH